MTAIQYPTLKAQKLHQATGVERIFSMGALRYFSKFIQGEEVVKFDFYHLKLKKHPFFLKISKLCGDQAPCPPSDVHAPGFKKSYWLAKMLKIKAK